ncbi:hypothetical protein [Geothrix fuzhouensis]|uniref:hypothetical protein n=1 Tax=Geothrix fuzhouensis TaxID=2966451 RepID=UPI002147C1E6|nr:hypothetical protein [Geothrix fuzhouensis]
MTRTTLALGAAALTITLGAGVWWATRRNPGAPPQEEVLEPFRASAMGAGQLIDLQPPTVPLRQVRWTPPLPGGAAVAQVLSQTGRQQAVLFLQGTPGPAITLAEPTGIPARFFQFADLVDAALAPDDALVLLYRSSEDAAAPGLVMAWDLKTQQTRWSQQAPGEHLALSPNHRSAFLFGAGTPVTILDLANRAGSHKPVSTLVELPPEVKGIASLLPLGPRSFRVAHDLGLSTWRNGAWTHIQAPPPSPLGFSRGLGLVAGTAKAGWWQPEPGTLIPLNPDGKAGEPRDLKALLPEASSLDAGLLHLLGGGADGHLWFSLARPTLPAPAPVPAPAPAPTLAPASGASDPPLLENTAPPVPPPPALPTLEPSREVWEAHISRGLDRLYLWKPGEDHMKVILLADAWKRLAAPPGIPVPRWDGGDLRPEAGALLCGGPDQVWWLPLTALQPR